MKLILKILFLIQIMRGESVQICKSFGSKFQALFYLLGKVDCKKVVPCSGTLQCPLVVDPIALQICSEHLITF